MQNKQLTSVINYWLLQFGVIWVLSIAFTVIPHIYYNSVHGNPGGLEETGWQYFIKETSHFIELSVILFLTLLTEINYRYFYHKLKLPSFICACLVVAVLSFILLLLIDRHKAFKWNEVIARTILIWYAAAYVLGYALLRDYFESIRRKKDIQVQQSKNELDALKAQLNPHFLFNSLNYLYGKALNENASITADGIDKLSSMMRYTITGTHENYVPIEVELSFIKSYLEMQRARIADKESIDIQINIEDAPKALLIAPMLLLPFIENAFKYGLSLDEHCYIHLNINFTGDNISLNINNSINQNTMTVKGNNTGIKNTVKRLDLLYPGKYELKHSVIGNAYKVTLTVKLTS